MIVSNAQDIGAALKQARTAKGLTQQQVGAMIGVTRQWVASVEAGAPTARLGLVIDALKCVDQLLQTRPDDSQSLVNLVFPDAT